MERGREGRGRESERERERERGRGREREREGGRSERGWCFGRQGKPKMAENYFELERRMNKLLSLPWGCRQKERERERRGKDGGKEGVGCG